MKVSASKTRLSIDVEYEFADGQTFEFRYFSPTTETIEAALSAANSPIDEQAKIVKKALESSIVGDAGLVGKMIDELETDGNIFAFKRMLDEALGKHVSKGSKGS